MDKKILNTIGNRVSFLYIEKARLEENEYTVQCCRGKRIIEIPIATIACVILGPGTSITHGAVKMFSECGCSVIWMGNNMQYMYCYGDVGTNSGKNILLQARYNQDKKLHMQVVKNMYSIRYPGQATSNYKLEQLRGIEGKKLKELYVALADKYEIEWSGRKYNIDDFEAQDNVNKCLTWCNQFLYAIVKSVILYMGFSPSLGFIHTGHIDSFVFDIADLYKEKISIVCAFEVAASSAADYYLECRSKMHSYISSNKLMSIIPKDMKRLFSDADNLPEEIALWNVDGTVEYGKNYGEK